MVDSNRLAGRKVFITGGGSGIGRSAAVRAAAEGAAVAVVDLRTEIAQQVADEIAESGGTAVAVAADVGDEQQVAAAVVRAADGLGGIDGVVASAGTAGAGWIHETDLADWEAVIKQIAVDYGDQHIRANCVCPGGVKTGLARHAAEDTRSHSTPTPEAGRLPRSIAVPPIPRLSHPDEQASVIAFLLSDEASFMTGSSVLVDGGFTAI